MQKIKVGNKVVGTFKSVIPTFLYAALLLIVFNKQISDVEVKNWLTST